jgi:hypothetical protein
MNDQPILAEFGIIFREDTPKHRHSASTSTTPSKLIMSQWECEICTYAQEGNETFIIGSSVCADCIRDYFAAARKDGLPIRWEGELLDLDDFRRFLDDDMVRFYEEHAAEWACAIPERVYCGHPGQPNTEDALFIGQRLYDSDRLCRRCRLCGQHACLTCRAIVRGDGQGGPEERIDHGCNPNAEEEFWEEYFAGKVAGIDYQICPNGDCQRAIELDGGCNHIICNCGTELCYIYGQEAHEGTGHWDGQVNGACPRHGPRVEEDYPSSDADSDEATEDDATADDDEVWHLPPPPEELEMAGNPEANRVRAPEMAPHYEAVDDEQPLLPQTDGFEAEAMFGRRTLPPQARGHSLLGDMVAEEAVSRDGQANIEEEEGDSHGDTERLDVQSTSRGTSSELQLDFIAAMNDRTRQ